MISKTKSYFRKEIDGMEGYTPGEQPQDMQYVKLNTNENPYPPSPSIAKFLKLADYRKLRLYPDPCGCELRKIIAKLHDLNPENIILGNGSDDILTMIARCFAGEKDTIACFDPSYSLYPVLAELQGAKCIKIPLIEKDGFRLPADSARKASGAKLFLIARPNAPTGTAFPKDEIENLCRKFNGMVFIDEAYADFADDNCVDFVGKFPNVIIGRTLSKSYSLAGLRLGYALSIKKNIEGMIKVKDSYNVGYLAQKIAAAALCDRKYFRENIGKIKKSRAYLTVSLREKGFKVGDSKANFVFASPSDENAGRLYKKLKKNGVLVRYFAGPVTRKYVRITVGTDTEIEKLLQNL